MGLKSYLKDKITRVDRFEKEVDKSVSSLYAKQFQADVSTTNGSAFLNGGYYSHSSVSHSPPPSFLTKTPLGTSNEEAVEFTPRHELPANRQRYEGMKPTLPSHRQTFEQAKQAPEKLKKKTNWLKKSAEVHKRVSKNGIVHRWVYEEVGLSMSKMSIMSMVLGLLFLGILFFIIGFLAAVATLKTQEGGKAHSSQSAWQASNKPAHDQPGVSDALGGIAAGMGGRFVNQTLNKEFQPLNSAIGKVAKVVPAPLQPFARYGINTGRLQAKEGVRQVNPFVPHGRRVAAQQPYGSVQPQPQLQQQYAMAQPQGYPLSNSAPQGYPQQMAFPQGGNQMYGAPQQQQMVMPQQQIYYQQPMAPQQQMMAPQQQMMTQQPQYQQQMAPQQGYLQ
jgi:hypothetical protein